MRLTYFAPTDVRGYVIRENALARENGEEVVHFAVHLVGRGDGVGDFVAEQLAIALAEAVDSDLDRAIGHGELRGKGGVRLSLAVADEARF